MVEEKTKNLISLREAIKYCPYSQGYLAFLIRQGKLKGMKIGKSWVTKKEWLKEYLANLKKYK